MVVCIDPNSTIGRIDPKLHGQFIEFLGECIDEGLWVGEDSPIENECGYRKATLDALRALQPPVIRWTITASAPTNSCVCVKCSALNRGSISTCFPAQSPK